MLLWDIFIINTYVHLVLLVIIVQIHQLQIHDPKNCDCVPSSIICLVTDATTCFCTVCPNGNATCELKPNGQCFAAKEQDPDGEWAYSYGCLAPVDEEGGQILQVS